jgi:DNA-binding NtrC family response regulator
MLDPTVPVVAVTGSTDPDLHRRATAEGASCLLMKPIKLDDLRAALGDVAGSDGEGLAAAPGPIEPPRTAGQVLVIDDEPGVRQLLTELLTKDGHQVRSAADGLDGLRAIMTATPDAVLLDVTMPRLGGIEALEAIRSLEPTIQVVMISGGTDIDVAKAALDGGAFDYVPKPFDPRHVRQVIQWALLMRSLDAEAESQRRPGPSGWARGGACRLTTPARGTRRGARAPRTGRRRRLLPSPATPGTDSITVDCLSLPPDSFFSMRCSAAPASVPDSAPAC